MNPQLIQNFLHTERLPGAYGEDARHCFVPLAAELIQRCNSADSEPLFVGINGAQGTGKTTLSKFLTHYCREAGLQVVELSIDDFYLSKAARLALAEEIHPLLATRGVPGTHDTKALHVCLDRLLNSEVFDATSIPRFDKATDNPAPKQHWSLVHGPVDMVILEGWFIGVGPEAESNLSEPINELEAQSDQTGCWRRYVNATLATDYAPLFSHIDMMLMLQAPSFEQVYAWRGLQEEKLRQSRQEARGSDLTGIMSTAQLSRFIQHFERLTRHSLATLPASADLVFSLNQAHRVVAQVNRLGAP
jgi:D-glycerate 3-kinase